MISIEKKTLIRSEEWAMYWKQNVQNVLIQFSLIIYPKNVHLLLHINL